MAVLDLNWGPNLTSVSYRLLLADATYGNLVNLTCGYSLGQPEFEKTDPIKIMYNCLLNGRIVPYTLTVRGALIRERTYPFLLPQGRTLYTPLHALFGNNCPRDVYLDYLCPTDPTHGHFRRYPMATFDEPEETSVLVEGVESGAPLTEQSMMHTFKSMMYFYVSVHEQSTDGDGAVHAVTFECNSCPGCNPYEHRDLLYGGDEFLKISTNALASGTDVTVTIPTDGIIEAIVCNGNVKVAVYSVDGAPDTGGIFLSLDDGVTWTAVGPTTVAFYAALYANGYYWAFGEEGSIYYSANGSTWTQMTVPGAHSAAVYRAAAVDPVTKTIYVVGNVAAAGAMLKINGFAGTVITTLLPGSPGILYAVKVLEGNHVVVGGAAGYFAEHANIAEGGNFANGTISTGAIHGIAGDIARTIVSSGTKLFIRDVSNDLSFTEMDYDTGTALAGVINVLAEGKNDLGANYFAGGTESGELFLIYPAFPQAI